MTSLIDGLGFQIVTVTPATARCVADAYASWGRGVSPVALYVGDDFSKTAIAAALPSGV